MMQNKRNLWLSQKSSPALGKMTSFRYLLPNIWSASSSWLLR